MLCVNSVVVDVKIPPCQLPAESDGRSWLITFVMAGWEVVVVVLLLMVMIMSGW